ncbi:hypothetical protein L198_04642 [Cryptococcus wingfieldii CBS 7118]|uniref:RING-type domain-containing protein n=1 Tax=Cryptococcus wingfieldii CBS 7118 TaxID=1295528 RepID=A0A1E3J324_9TREE|nr:hypothetical protein L198_04642 [Cryptococcus wingfieldii CBS 7118]ODN95253.1 hypothetical protein L198_04642 [Cryptococcus wingfieldii CBS 7118]
MTSLNSVSGWYTNAYSGPFRTSRLRAPSLLPGARIPAPVQQTLVVDAAHNNSPSADDANPEGKDGVKNVKRRETVFGPDVGEDDEPGWGEGGKEEISVDVVKKWVEKAKADEGIHPTTTLQALVNLKRPSLLLQQVDQPQPKADKYEDITPYPTAAQSDSPTSPTSLLPTPPLHTLKFTYDATTPAARITLLLYPNPRPRPTIPEGGGKASFEEGEEEEQEPTVIYTGLHAGGFGQVFDLPKEWAMDLSSAIRIEEEDQTTKPEVKEEPVEQVQELNEQPEEQQGRRRFGIFGRRRGESDVEAGNANIEMTSPVTQSEEKEAPKQVEYGMRILIKIEATGPEGQHLKRRNAQLTHILITGTWVNDPNSGDDAGPGGKRVWVVKVARREAVIGSHTFLLKEIFGLSATSSTATSYPPTADDPYASTPNECIVCLTSPRDVVLLPCRHLVVCRDCAVGMVEFGAGGKVARREEAPATGTGAGGGGDGEAGGEGGTDTPATTLATTTTHRERRKKKVKGWYCPVCRQPYISLLRLALPQAKASEAHSHHELSRQPSRASVRTTRTTKSLAPTLPDGAERFLEGLRPEGADAELELEEGEDKEAGSGSVRPGWVGGAAGTPDVEKPEVEHKEIEESEFTGPSPTPATMETPSHPEGDVADEGKGKGWKEVA